MEEPPGAQFPQKDNGLQDMYTLLHCTDGKS